MTIEEHIKATLKEFRPTSQKINFYSQNIQERCSKYFTVSINGQKIKLFVFETKIELQIKIDTKLLFAISRPDLVCFANKELNQRVGTYKVFTDRSKDELVIKCITLIDKKIEALGLELDEALFVYGNVIQLAINQSRGLIPEIDSLISLKSKIEKAYPRKLKTDLSKIPANLHELVPFLEDWAISDDTERQEKINDSSKSELKKLTNAVMPRMNAINTYLDSFKNQPLTQEATLIGNLAELVTELTLSKQH